MEDTFNTFPECESCEIFKKTKTHPNRALMCETARATGTCPKDLWKQRIVKELRKIARGYPRNVGEKKLAKEILGNQVKTKTKEEVGFGCL